MGAKNLSPFLSLTYFLHQIYIFFPMKLTLFTYSAEFKGLRDIEIERKQIIFLLILIYKDSILLFSLTH